MPSARALAAASGAGFIYHGFVEGDHVVIRWRFRFEWLDGSETRLEELAWQRWEGERIAEEIFFYDPAQLAPVRPG